MTVDLPYPDKPLWPNGRAHYHAKARAFKAHKNWAIIAARESLPVCFRHNGEPMPIRVTVYPKARGAMPDADNVVASAKAYLDGIAHALGVDDKHFLAPVVAYSDRRTSRFVIEVAA